MAKIKISLTGDVDIDDTIEAAMSKMGLDVDGLIKHIKNDMTDTLELCDVDIENLTISAVYET